MTMLPHRSLPSDTLLLFSEDIFFVGFYCDFYAVTYLAIAPGACRHWADACVADTLPLFHVAPGHATPIMLEDM